MLKNTIQEVRGVLRRRRLRGTKWASALDRILETNAVFVHVPKCGGKSVVRDVYGLGEHAWFGHATINFYRSLLGPRRFRAAFKFAFVRDPVTRCLSGFEFRQRGGFGLPNDKALMPELAGLSFEQFVMGGKMDEFLRKDTVFRPQTRFLVMPDGQIGLDRVCAFEKFDEEMRALPIEMTTATPSHINAAPRRARCDVSSEIRNRIAEAYAEDYRLIASLAQ